MGLFSKKTIIKSPVSGTVLDLKDVNDPVFSQGMMGPGFAVKDHDGNIYSPIDGIVESIFPTKHAITLGTKSGIQVLLHLGIDTVELAGEPFEILVTEGQEVKQGEKIANMDIEIVRDLEKDPIIMVLFPDKKPGTLVKVNERIAMGEDVYKLAN